MHAKVHRDLTPTLILPLIRSLRRSGGGKPPHCAIHAAAALEYWFAPDLVSSSYTEPTPHGSATTSPPSTFTPATTMLSSSNMPSGETD
jgi:hypothetical protein